MHLKWRKNWKSAGRLLSLILHSCARRGIIFSRRRADIFLEKQEPDGYTGIILCQHGSEAIREEFYRIVDNGGVVLDVSIDHPIYGLLSASLNIRSRYDANLFLEQLGASTAKPLSALTEGFHTHRIRTEHAEDFARIEASLRELGILVDA